MKPEERDRFEFVEVKYCKVCREPAECGGYCLVHYDEFLNSREDDRDDRD